MSRARPGPAVHKDTYRDWAKRHDQDEPRDLVAAIRFLGSAAGSENREWLRELEEIAVREAKF